jgi:hypothetical protein
MRLFTLTAVVFLASALGALGASLPETSLHGTYVEARTADVYTGPCFANGEVGLAGRRAVLGWMVEKGSWQGVALDGLGVVGVAYANDTLGAVTGNPYPVKSVLIVDETAGPEQRLALQAFAKRMAGDLFQDVVRVEYRPISLSVKDGNLHSATAQMTAGELAKIETRALHNGDHICSNEEVWYRPLTKLDHAMPAYTKAHSYQGDGLNTRWSTPHQRSAFVGHFQLQD